MPFKVYAIIRQLKKLITPVRAHTHTHTYICLVSWGCRILTVYKHSVFLLSLYMYIYIMRLCMCDNNFHILISLYGHNIVINILGIKFEDTGNLDLPNPKNDEKAYNIKNPKAVGQGCKIVSINLSINQPYGISWFYPWFELGSLSSFPVEIVQ